MKIGGFLKQSFVDFPSTISAVIFTNGCNLSCWYCHNKQLINGKLKNETKLSEIYDFLESRKGFLDGVVISGGEPTMQYDLEEVIDHLKLLGYKVKLDTNGTKPDILEKLLPKVDYVAMDIKNSFGNYEKTVGKTNLENIKQSIRILKKSKNYEFRTTFSPDITLDDMECIGKSIEGTEHFYLQTYVPQNASQIQAHTNEDFDNAIKIIKKYVKNAEIR